MEDGLGAGVAIRGEWTGLEDEKGWSIDIGTLSVAFG
jgi:hypothetical protein